MSPALHVQLHYSILRFSVVCVFLSVVNLNHVSCSSPSMYLSPQCDVLSGSLDSAAGAAQPSTQWALWDEVVGCIVLGSHPHWEITIQPTVFPKVTKEHLVSSAVKPPFSDVPNPAVHAAWGSRLYSCRVVILPCFGDNYTIYCLPWGAASLQFVL